MHFGQRGIFLTRLVLRAFFRGLGRFVGAVMLTRWFSVGAVMLLLLSGVF